jgi:signal transduction histidine kinase
VRGIAFKIFLSFWLIFAVLIASFALRRGDPAVHVRLDDYAYNQGAIAAKLLAQRGAAACGDFADAVVERGMQLALFDANGNVLCHASGADPTILRKHLRDSGGRASSDSGSDAVSDSVTVTAIDTPSGARVTAVGVALPRFAETAVRPSFPYRSVAYAIVISGLVCFAMARYLARPLRLVRDTSYRLASGELKARAGDAVGRRRDEIGDLVRDFDAMAARIEAQVEAQQQLLHDISHELRSPLARLNVALELARRKATPDSSAELERIEREAERMNDLIGRLLILARAENDPNHATVPVDISAVVRQVVADAQYEAQRKSKSVVLNDTAAPTVSGHPQLVASAVDNVVRNGLRHTAPQSAVEVSLDATPDEAIISVRDHGPGVPVSDLEKIFSPFYRLEASRKRDTGGVGLGLAIARRAIAVHHGTIAAENAENGGLRVTIRLPIDKSLRQFDSH